MKIGVIDTTLFKQVIAIIKKGSKQDEGSLKFNKYGMECMAMDPANIALIDVRLLKKDFMSYTLKSEVMMTIDLVKLNDIIKNCKGDLIIEFDEDENKAVFKSGNMTIHQAIVGNEYATEPKVPQFEATIDAMIPAEDFSYGIQTASLCNNLAKLAFNREGFKISGEGVKDTAEVVVSEDPAEEEAIADYDVEYLKDLLKLVEGDIELEMASDSPMKLEWTIATSSKALYFLAPRVQPD